MAAINGTDGGNVLGGGIGSDTIKGRRGDDTLTGGGGQDTFVIRLGDGTTTITDFGGVGTGIRPTSEEIAEVDTLQFEGAGLTAENLLLTQQESDLLISFEGVQDTQVVLQDFALEDLDNLQRSTGAAVDLGNILFNGQSEIADSFDVVNANQVGERVFNSNTVTFLDDSFNSIPGRSNSNDVINAQGGFDEISGLSGNDLLRGGDGDDALSGDAGNDLLRGGADNDSLAGGGSAVAEVDTLTGGAGGDTFLLSDQVEVLYDDGNPATAGTADYALISDFNSSEDVIQLFGQPSDYRLVSSPSGLPAGTAILLDEPGEEPDELIGIVQGNANLSLDSDGFSFNQPALNLAELDGSNGFVIDSFEFGEYGYTGSAVSTAGDINGDGFDDLIFGAEYAEYSNESFVVFGSGAGFDASLSFSSLDGSNGFVINGSIGDRLGNSVSTAGDVNGDGFDDLLIGAPQFSITPYGVYADAGQSYVVFGSGAGFDASLDLAELDGSNGFVLQGIDYYDYTGGSVSTAGDVNGDGFDDVIIGASGAGTNGRSYVVFGSGESFAASLDLASLNGSNGFVINGASGSVSTAGDVNGDGFDDVIIGASGAGTNGRSYVVFGSEAGFDASLDVAELDGNNGFVINSGGSVSTAGDVNGDDFDDVIVGTPFAGPAGGSYVVFGSGAGFDASFDLAELDGSNGFAINGIDENDFSGDSVSTAGDVNGDGFDDLLIGAPGADPNGQAYVVFGSGAGFDASISLAELDGSNGFAINGDVMEDRIGDAVSDAGDVNGDDFDDLLIGTSFGRLSYVVFGGDFGLPQEAGPEVLAGTFSSSLQLVV